VRWISCLLFAISLAVAAAAPVLPASAVFPFRLQDGLLWVSVQVKGSPVPLEFLLDSGAQVSVLNLETSRQLGVRLASPVSVQGVKASATGYWPQRLSARICSVKLPDQWLALDLSALSHACGKPVAGLIGADFFRNRAVQIDFETQQVRILKGRLPQTLESLPLEVRPNGFCVQAQVNGHSPQRFRLDTGCASALQWVTPIQPSTLQSSKLAVGVATLVIPQTETTLSLGRRTFSKTPTGVHDTAIFAGEGGLLGTGFLSRFESVIVDARSKRLILGSLRSSR
jgi:hypothetical protein